MDAAASAHRKVELQSPEDFTYLLNNVRRAAAESIGAAFPLADDDAEDALRARIEELVDDYIARTFALAAPNVSINGLPVPESLLPKEKSNGKTKDKGKKGSKKSKKKGAAAEDEDENVVYEPFDARLRDRIPDLLREEEELLREIAALKRRVPAQAATRVGDALKAGVAADEAALAAAKERVGDVDRDLRAKGRKRMLDSLEGGVDEGSAAAAPAISVLQRNDEVAESFGTAVEGLGRLKRDMPATVARMERARAAGSYVIAGR
ncbi:hypothetical protein MGG_00906 [Pyricularia oryzae 70-15]|uniref:Kinetochore protein mis14 n=2 Tax=Pyricularia oryzae TaxID=318829 RepID=G4NDN2_PYRO7|nr:uncharacterized protein MGG_00906 [Pyricularia oryzae 70-15]EHA48470.1 hypothetical protein MGG_00906 [Pyricularia oryzae 70-15]KAI7921554.1 hypothetical protein M9X92_005329 [Pyricularia oryzae]KAI7925190.1 hypothetical protein M0657_004356 [Pyricularia oryzae]